MGALLRQPEFETDEIHFNPFIVLGKSYDWSMDRRRFI